MSDERDSNDFSTARVEPEPVAEEPADEGEAIDADSSSDEDLGEIVETEEV